MIFRLVCECGRNGRAEVDEAKVPPGLTPLQAAFRFAKKVGWHYRGGRIGKSVVTLVCDRCREVLHLDADVLPSEAVPSTYAEDLSVGVDSEPVRSDVGGGGHEP